MIPTITYHSRTHKFKPQQSMEASGSSGGPPPGVGGPPSVHAQTQALLNLLNRLVSGQCGEAEGGGLEVVVATAYNLCGTLGLLGHGGSGTTAHLPSHPAAAAPQPQPPVPGIRALAEARVFGKQGVTAVDVAGQLLRLLVDAFGVPVRRSLGRQQITDPVRRAAHDPTTHLLTHCPHYATGAVVPPDRHPHVQHMLA